MKKITFILLFSMVCSLGFAQTFTSDATSDPATYPADMQNGNGTTALTCGTADELTLPSTAVTGIGTLGTTNVLQSVTINVTHTWADDVVISLQDPSGAVTVLLMDDKGNQADGFNVILQDGATPLPDGGDDGPAISGTFAPDEALALFNPGTVAADGVWNLLVCDDAGGDVGTVDSWALTFAPTPSCDSPSGLGATPTDTTADLSWLDVPTATLGFEWVILAPGGDPDVDTPLFSGSTGAGVVTDTATGLTPETDYEFFVRSNCDTAGFSGWSSLFAFTTPASPPANDDACNAIMLNIGDASSGAFYTNVGATVETGEVPGDCYFGTPSASETVWFSFVAPMTGQVLIQTEELAGDGSLNDTQITLFTIGDCADLSTATQVACDEDDDANIVGDGTGLQANLLATGLTDGATYYFVIDGFGAATGTFDVSLTEPPLNVESFENENAFTYFPNPVKNELTLSAAQKDITNVAVYNMLGQEVLRTAPNALESTINMNTMSQGAYFVQVTIGNVTETIRIIKQ